MARTKWIFILDDFWLKINEKLREAAAENLSEYQEQARIEEARQLAKQVLAKHREIVTEDPSLRGDKTLEQAIAAAFDIFGSDHQLFKVPAEEEVSKVEVPKKPAVKAAPRKRAGPGQIRIMTSKKVPGRVNWRRLVGTLTGAAVLSAVLYVILPVNMFTVALAIGLPLTLFLLMKSPKLLC